MNILTQQRNYLPVDLETRFNACKRRKISKWPIRKVCSFYHVKKSSLERRLSRFDGTQESLLDKSHRPKKPHPKTLSQEVIEKVLTCKRKHPKYFCLDVYMDLRRDNIVISFSSVVRILKRNNEYTPYVSNAKKKHDKPYDTPKMIGVKWQMDVKYVPKECCVIPGVNSWFYQYTILDECDRKRFLFFTNEHSMYETVRALKAVIKFFGYAPLILQTDNGFEFTDQARRKDIILSRSYPNLLESFCVEFGIMHKLIRPRTPEHNGKVERSHRIDQDKFYRTLRFYSLDDLVKQGKSWNKRYNNMPKFVLGCKTPNEVEIELFEEFCKIRAEQGLKSLTSIEC